MTRSRSILIAAGLLCLCLPGLASAHPGEHDHGGFTNDLLHLLPALDHPLALAGIGVVMLAGILVLVRARRRG